MKFQCMDIDIFFKSRFYFHIGKIRKNNIDYQETQCISIQYYD